MSRLFDEHVDFCEVCCDTKNDDALSETEKGERMEQCFDEWLAGLCDELDRGK